MKITSQLAQTMSLTLQPIFTNKNLSPRTCNLPLSPIHLLKSHKFRNNSKTHFANRTYFTSSAPFSFLITKPSKAAFQEPYETSQDQIDGTSAFNFDAFLSILEIFSLASSLSVAVYVAVSVSYGIQKGGGGFLGLVGSKILAWQCVVLVSGVVIGAVIRRRQWQRICGVRLSRSSSSPFGANLLERVEKLEQDLRNEATIVRVLSRQLEKLGIRFRVTRKALKDPIAEATALSQKNSEATRALAAQEDNLEKELGEIQKVLLAMQEQQQKQLELILAIGKAGKLWDTKHVKSRNESKSETSKPSVDGAANLEVNHIETRALQPEAKNDRP